MPSRRIPDPLPPDWPAAKALRQLRLQLDALQRFKSRGYPDAKAEHSSWFNEVAMILRHAFGIQHPNYSDFQSSGYAVGQYRQYEREEVKEQLNFDARVRKEESCVNTYIRELELMLPDEQTGQAPATSSPDTRSQLLLLCRRFHRCVTALAKREKGKAALVVSDEYDLQYLLNALLRVHFNDVRSEECTGSHAGGAARMDFLLKAEQLVVEAKMTRPTLKDREIGEELLLDIARYKQHPDCKELICLIYDPSYLIENPHGLGSDLEKMSSDELPVAVVITPER
jgi:hypothetical protein